MIYYYLLYYYFQSWHKAGVIRVKDTFCEKNFLNVNDFCSKFAIKVNFFAYYGLCNSKMDSLGKRL